MKLITYTLFKERFDHFFVHGWIFIHLRHKRSNALLCIFLHCQTTRHMFSVGGFSVSSRRPVTRKPSSPASLIMLSSSEYVCRGGKDTTPAAWSASTSGAALLDRLLHPGWHAPHGRRICLQDWQQDAPLLKCASACFGASARLQSPFTAICEVNQSEVSASLCALELALAVC